MGRREGAAVAPVFVITRTSSAPGRGGGQGAGGGMSSADIASTCEVLF